LNVGLRGRPALWIEQLPHGIYRSRTSGRGFSVRPLRAQKLISSGVVEGLNDTAKVTMRKSYGFRPKLHIQIQETIFHPGHYRIALAASPADLPPDPDVITTDSEKGPRSVSAPIQDAPRPPILADGLFTHTTKRTDLFEADVEIPNINCDKCTLQTTQFMAQHGYNNPGGYHYHHCANLQITADPSKPLNGAWPGIR
jgi:hypothetical protein